MCLRRQYFCFVAITLCSELTVGVFSYLHQQRTDAALADVIGRKLAKYYGVPERARETMAIDFAQYKVFTTAIGIDGSSVITGHQYSVAAVGRLVSMRQQRGCVRVMLSAENQAKCTQTKRHDLSIFIGCRI